MQALGSLSVTHEQRDSVSCRRTARTKSTPAYTVPKHLVALPEALTARQEKWMITFANMPDPGVAREVTDNPAVFEKVSVHHFAGLQG